MAGVHAAIGSAATSLRTLMRSSAPTRTLLCASPRAAASRAAAAARYAAAAAAAARRAARPRHALCSCCAAAERAGVKLMRAVAACHAPG